jgi:electron transport complex protein RnfC
MLLKTFKRGIHPKESKLSASSKIIISPAPKKIILPLRQNIGGESIPIVKIGDKIKKYQKVAKASPGLSTPIHSPISGTVIDISNHLTVSGNKNKSIVIEADDESTSTSTSSSTSSPNLSSSEKLTILDPKIESNEKLLERIKEAGIVGLGGASFPTSFKLSTPKEKKIDTIIVNGCECEPYLTSDHRVMLEFPSEIIKALKVVLQVTKARKAIIGIESNKKDAYKVFKKITDKEKNIDTILVATKYPQGAEKLLIYSLLRRKVPDGGLPLDVGVVVNNVATLKAIHDSIYLGLPLTQKIVTVSGDIPLPKNILANIGTQVKDLIEEFQPEEKKIGKILVGGPMMGFAQESPNAPIEKGTNGIILLSKKRKEEIKPCIRCGKCVDVCPLNLIPTKIAQYSEHKLYNLSKKHHAKSCFECGSCSYICPSNIPLVQLIRHAKKNIK